MKVLWNARWSEDENNARESSKRVAEESLSIYEESISALPISRASAGPGWYATGKREG